MSLSRGEQERICGTEVQRYM